MIVTPLLSWVLIERQRAKGSLTELQPADLRAPDVTSECDPAVPMRASDSIRGYVRFLEDSEFLSFGIWSRGQSETPSCPFD